MEIFFAFHWRSRPSWNRLGNIIDPGLAGAKQRQHVFLLKAFAILRRAPYHAPARFARDFIVSQSEDEYIPPLRIAIIDLILTEIGKFVSWMAAQRLVREMQICGQSLDVAGVRIPGQFYDGTERRHRLRTLSFASICLLRNRVERLRKNQGDEQRYCVYPFQVSLQQSSALA